MLRPRPTRYMNEQIAGLGATLSRFPIDLEKATQSDKLDYILVMVHGVAGDVGRLKDDIKDLKARETAMQKDTNTSRTLSIIALIFAIFACAGVIGLFLYMLLG